MRMWLLLTSLLVSGLAPLGDRDGDGVEGHYYSWNLCRKLLLLSGPMTPTGRGAHLWIRTEKHCMCIQESCSHVAELHSLRTSSSHLAYVAVAPHSGGRSFPICLTADTLLGLHGIRRAKPALQAGGGVISHFAMDIIKDRPHSKSARSLHHGSPAASGHDFQAFPLEKPIAVEQQKVMPKRCCAAPAVVISCCLKEGDIRPAMTIRERPGQQTAQAQIRQKDIAQPGMHIQAPRKYDGQRSSNTLVNRRDRVQTAAVRRSDKSQLQTQRSEHTFMKKNERLMSIRRLTLEESLQKQLSVKAASRLLGNEDDDDDGFYVEKKLSFVTREKKDAVNRLRYKLRATQGDHKEDFSGKIITKQAELRRPEAGSETEGSHTNGNQDRLAHILHTARTNQRDNNNVDHKEMLAEVGEDALITLLVMEAQTQAASEIQIILSSDTGWKTVKQPVNPTSITGVTQENFIIAADNSGCECWRETLFLLCIHETDRKEAMDLRPAESKVKVTTEPEQVAQTTQEVEHTETNSTPHENISRNQTKQQENGPSEETVIPSPPPLEITDTETTAAEHTAQTVTGNVAVKQTTSSSEVTNQGGTQRAVRPPTTTTKSPEPETDNELGFISSLTRNIEPTTREALSGLRMRENTTTKPHEATEKTEREATKRPESPTEEDPGSADDTAPPCRGLIDRTEAGWKRCMERFAGAGSKLISSRETTTGAFKETGEPEKGHTSAHDDKLPDDNDDEYEHFYYFDGVLKRVRNNFYPHDRGERRRGKGSHDASERSVRTGGENLLRYIKRLTLRNKENKNYKITASY